MFPFGLKAGEHLAQVGDSADQHDDCDYGECRSGEEETRHPEVVPGSHAKPVIVSQRLLHYRAMGTELKKAVVLARGLGTRMRRDADAELTPEQRSVADTGLKAMIPVGRPFLDYVLSGLADAGYQQICLVIGPEHQVVRDYYGKQDLRRISLTYAIQQDPIGTANAVLSAARFVGDDEFLVMNSDNYYPVPALSTLHDMGEPGVVLFNRKALVRNSNIPAERVLTFAFAAVRDGYMVSLIEKPDANTIIPPDTLVSMNVWRFSPEILRFCREVPRSSRGEYELPQAVNLGVQHGMRLRVERSEFGVLDLSRRDDIADVAQRLAGIQVRL